MAMVEQELTVQSLRKHRVELISHAEPLANDDTGDMFRKLIGIVNEYQSKETSRATTRTMLANARLGHSNGVNIPYGCMSVDSDIIGNKQKKKLAIEPAESEIVKLAFDLARNGDGTSGPLGTKKVAMWLNERGYRTRKGSLFGTGTVHELLTREAYMAHAASTNTTARSESERRPPTSSNMTCPRSSIASPSTPCKRFWFPVSPGPGGGGCLSAVLAGRSRAVDA